MGKYSIKRYGWGLIHARSIWFRVGRKEFPRDINSIIIVSISIAFLWLKKYANYRQETSPLLQASVNFRDIEHSKEPVVPFIIRA